MAEVIWAIEQAPRTDNLSNFLGMDPSEIPDRLRRAGKSQSDLARWLNLDPSSLTKTIKGLRRLKADELFKIEAFFDQAPEPSRGVGEGAPARWRAPTTRRIPIYGYAAAGGDGERVALATGQVIDWIELPPLWQGSGEFFGVRVLGDSMEPRYHAGEIAVARAGLPPRRDADVIAEFNNDTALLKTYKGARDGRVFLQQWNPEKSLDFDASSVRALHSVERSARAGSSHRTCGRDRRARRRSAFRAARPLGLPGPREGPSAPRPFAPRPTCPRRARARKAWAGQAGGSRPSRPNRPWAKTCPRSQPPSRQR